MLLKADYIMKKQKRVCKERVFDQAIEFYYESCMKANTLPILVSPWRSEIKRRFVHLRNIQGSEVLVRHTVFYLYVTLVGTEYFRLICDQSNNLDAGESQ